MRQRFIAALILLSCTALFAQAQTAGRPLTITSVPQKKLKAGKVQYDPALRDANGQLVATYPDLEMIEAIPGTSLYLSGRGFRRVRTQYDRPEKVGLLDAYTGRELVPCEAERVELLSYCAVLVRMKDKAYRVVSAAGDPMHSGDYEYVQPPQATNYFRAFYGFKQGGKHGLIDSCGVVRVPARYSYPLLWDGQAARARIGDKWNLLNSEMQEIGPPRFSFLTFHTDGIYTYSTSAIADAYGKPQRGKVGLMNWRGEMLTEEIYEDVTSSANVVQAKQGGQWVTIDTRKLTAGKDVSAVAKITVPEVYQELGGKRKYGYRLGTDFLVKPQYDKAYPFQGRFAVVGNYGKHKIMTFEGGDVATATEHGLINLKGEEVVPLRYKRLWPYADGLYGFAVGADWEDSYLYGIMDTTGKVRVPADFKNLGELREGLIPARKITHFGFVDLSGKLIIPYAYKYATPFVNGIAAVAEDDNKWYWIDRSGKEIMPGRRFTNVSDWDSSGKAWTWNKMDQWNRPDSAVQITRRGEIVARRPPNGPPPPPPPNSRRCGRCRGSGMAYKARDVNSSFTLHEGMFAPIEKRTTYSYSYRVYEKDGSCPQCGGDGWE